MPNSTLPVGKYDTGGWQYTTPVLKDIKRDKLTLVTFNTWFKEYFAEQRYHALMRLLEHYRPDVITLQEVTPRSLPIFLAQPWIRDEYYTSDIDSHTLGDYGVLILSRMPPVSVHLLPLPTSMGRHVLVWETIVNGAPLHIATVHLESGDSAKLRQDQLGIIFAALRSVPDAVITGDFNFCAAWSEENDRIDPAYHDVWAALRGGEPGYTEDTMINRMLYHVKGKHKQVRFDRVLLKSLPKDAQGPHWQAETIDLLGTNPIAADMPEVFPSDHLGLLCQISAR